VSGVSKNPLSQQKNFRLEFEVETTMFETTMSKATTAVVSLLVVACVSVFSQSIMAVLAANAIVSTLFLALILIVTLAGTGSRRGRGRGQWLQRKWLLRHAAPGVVVLLASGLVWAVPTLTSFNGISKLIPHGSVSLNIPEDIVVDSQGNVYVIDLGADRLVEVTASGVVTTQTFSTLGGLSSPAGLAVDASGNIYVADSGNHRVVELAAGVESVVATGSLLDPTTGDPDGLVLDAAGDLFIADGHANDIVEVPANGTGAMLYSFTGATLSAPQGLAVDTEGNLYIADTGNSRIVTVTVGLVGSPLTIACSALSGPMGVAVDGSGNVYIADTGNSRIVKVSVSGSCAALASSQTLSHPAGVAVDYWGGTVYIANSVLANLVELLESPVNFGAVPVGSTTPTVMTLSFTLGTGVSLGNVKVLTMGAAKLDFTAVAGGTCLGAPPGAGPCTVNVQFSPTAPGLRKGTVELFSNASPTAPILTVPIYGTGNAPLAQISPGNPSVVTITGVNTDGPIQVALDGAGNMYVAFSRDSDVVKVPAGGGVGTVVSTSPIVLDNPEGVALDAAGNLYIADSGNGQVVEVTPAGVATQFVALANNGAPGPMAMDLAGNLYVVDFPNDEVIKVTPAGAQSPVSTGSIAVGGVAGVAVDAAGTVYLDDQGYGQVIKVTAAGAASIVTLPGFLGQAVDDFIQNPVGVGVDGMGNLYVTDEPREGMPIIWEVTTGGQTAAETGNSQNLGFNNPQGVAVDGNGNLFVPDANANQILELNAAAASGSFSGVFVNGQSGNDIPFIVTNIGNLALTLAANPTYTQNFSEYTNDPFFSLFLCGSDTALGAGEICAVDILFTPGSVGLLSANILVTDNSLNGTNVTQTIAITGIGLAADTTAVTVSTIPISAFAGQPITITALVSDTTLGDPAGAPNGGVTFTDTLGSTITPLNGGNPVTLDGTGTATLPGVLLSGAGLHTITASYLGVPGMLAPSSATTTIQITAPLASAVNLNIAPARTVQAGTATTLTATVTSNSLPVAAGTVLFCDATAAQCDGTAVFGSAQLTSAGTAAITLTLGVGTYSITAEFQAINSTLAGMSKAMTLTVTASEGYSSLTAITATGAPSGYTLTGTVTTFGTAPPAGTVSFLNTSNGNASLGSVALDPATLADVFIPALGAPLPAQSAAFVVSGDFNHDGIPDLAVLTSSFNGVVGIFLGNGDGTFQIGVNYSVGTNPQTIAVSDVNGDGNLDLIVSNSGDGTVSVLLGNSNGTFQTATTFAVGDGPQFVAAGDFNHDGVPDLAVANQGDGTVSILLGVGDGTFQTQVTYPVPSAVGIAVADFNNDGILDLAVTGDAKSSIVVILQGVGDGTFTQPNSFINLPANYAWWLAAGDLRKNGTVDLVVADSAGSNVYVLLGNGDLTFQTAVAYPVDQDPLGVSLGDVNGDGVLDLVVPDTADDGLVSVLIGNGDGTFAAKTDYSVGNNPVSVALADFNGDGQLDIATANRGSSTATVLLGAKTETAIITGLVLYGSGTDNVLASYSGDDNRMPSVSSTVPLTALAQTVTATTFTAEPNPAFAGQVVTLTAAVTPAPTGRAPTLRPAVAPGPIFSPFGTVSFFNGITLLGTVNVDSSGFATFTSGSLPTGALSVTAVYSGNAGSVGSTSAAQTVIINALGVNTTTTTTTLAATPNPATTGQTVTLTATVAPAPTGSPIGALSFYNGATLLGMGILNSSGIATFTTASLPTGASALTAVYAGNAGFAASTSPAVSETVTGGIVTTITTLTALPNPLADGQPATLTATVTPAPTGSPAGIISFYSGTTLLGTGTLNTAGVATFATSSLVVGTDSITAVYPGNAGFAASTSTAVGETVTTAYTITAPTTPVTVAPGGAATINITVPPLGGAFNNVVTLSATGLPPGATATFNPPTVTPGSAGATTVLAIQLAPVSAALPGGNIPANPLPKQGRFPVAPFGLAFVLFGTVLGRKRIPRTLVLGLAFAVLGASTLLVTGCGGGFTSPPSTTAGNYTVTVTGTSGSYTASTTVTLVVQ
jgi:sugar lactone lactonase YvrE